MAVTPTRTDQDMALRLNALPDEARVAAIATAFALQRETLKAQLPGAAQAASAAEILGEDAVAEFAAWLAREGEVSDPEALVTYWKEHRDA